MELKQGNTTRHLVIHVIDTSGNPVTGLVSGSTITVVISKNGGSFATPAGTITEIAHGDYKIAASAADANTLGGLRAFWSGSGILPQSKEWNVVAFDPDDAGALGLANIPSGPPGTTNGAVTMNTLFQGLLATYGAGAPSHSLAGMMKLLLNHKAYSGNDLIVYEADGTTEAFRITVTRDAAAQPVVATTSAT